MTCRRIALCHLAAATVGSVLILAPLATSAAPPLPAGGLAGLARPLPALPLVPVQDRGDPGGSTGGGTGGSSAGDGADRAAAPAAAAPAAARAAAAVPQPALSPPVTAAVAGSVGDAFDRCATVDAAYQIDCASQQLREAARQIATQGAYGNVSRILDDAGRKLADIARQGRDSGKPRLTVQHRNQGGSRTYAAVRTDTLARSRAAAVRVIEEAQTLLLRSTSNAANRRAHFQPIAAALNSGKVLLRST